MSPSKLQPLERAEERASTPRDQLRKASFEVATKRHLKASDVFPRIGQYLRTRPHEPRSHFRW